MFGNISKSPARPPYFAARPHYPFRPPTKLFPNVIPPFPRKTRRVPKCTGSLPVPYTHWKQILSPPLKFIGNSNPLPYEPHARVPQHGDPSRSSLVLPLAESLNMETPCRAPLVPETPVTSPKDPYFPPSSSQTESLNKETPSGTSPTPETTSAETPQSPSIETLISPMLSTCSLEIFPSSTEMTLNPRSRLGFSWWLDLYFFFINLVDKYQRMMH